VKLYPEGPLRFLFLLPALLLSQSPDSAHLRGVKVQTDSLRRETCRGGTLSASGLTCTKATATARVTTIRRLANRVDSIEVAALRLPPVVVSPPCTAVPGCNPGSPGNLGYVVQLHYESDSMYFPRPGVDSVTICGVLTDAAGARKLAWPPMLFIATATRDSGRLDERNGSAFTMTQKCARTLAVNGMTDTTSIPVVWSGDWITHQGRRIWRPFPALP